MQLYDSSQFLQSKQNNLLWTALSITEADYMVATFLVKGTATFITGPANLLNKAPKNLPDWIILDNWDLLSFIPIKILVEKTFFILAFHLAVGNNLCSNSSSWKVFFVILDIVPVLILLQIRVFSIDHMWVGLLVVHNSPSFIRPTHSPERILVLPFDFFLNC